LSKSGLNNWLKRWYAANNCYNVYWKSPILLHQQQTRADELSMFNQ